MGKCHDHVLLIKEGWKLVQCSCLNTKHKNRTNSVFTIIFEVCPSASQINELFWQVKSTSPLCKRISTFVVSFSSFKVSLSFFFFFFLSFSSMTSILQSNLSPRTETSHNVLLLGCVFAVFLPMSGAKRHRFLCPRLLGLYPPVVAVPLSRQVFTQPFSCLPVRSGLQTFTTPAVGKVLYVRKYYIHTRRIPFTSRPPKVHTQHTDKEETLFLTVESGAGP